MWLWSQKAGEGHFLHIVCEINYLTHPIWIGAIKGSNRRWNGNRCKWISKHGSDRVQRKSRSFLRSINYRYKLCTYRSALCEFTRTICIRHFTFGRWTWLPKSLVSCYWLDRTSSVYTNTYSIWFGFFYYSHFIITSQASPYAKKYEIASATQHPSYSAEKDINDIAILRVRTPIAFNPGVGPVCLPFKWERKQKSLCYQIGNDSKSIMSEYWIVAHTHTHTDIAHHR